jgi:hypothetical protein
MKNFNNLKIKFIYQNIIMNKTVSKELDFLSRSNIIYVSSRVGRNAYKEMIRWASENDLDDYESLIRNPKEELDYINDKFIKEHPRVRLEVIVGNKKYPKLLMDDMTEHFSVDDFREYDTQTPENIYTDMRRNNKPNIYQIRQHVRKYDRQNHSSNLSKHNLSNKTSIPINRYDMSALYKKNAFSS